LENNISESSECFQLDAETLYLLYDGECLLCRNTALALRLRQQVKAMVLLNAREPHPLIAEVNSLGLDLNKGIVVFYQGTVTSGYKAMHFLAQLAAKPNWFNKILASVFKYKWINFVCYPFFKMFRRILLWVRRIPLIKHKDS
jgi:predicted DCC family thiol-disulfide oxidoreductase YuxK